MGLGFRNALVGWWCKARPTSGLSFRGHDWLIYHSRSLSSKSFPLASTLGKQKESNDAWATSSIHVAYARGLPSASARSCHGVYSILLYSPPRTSSNLEHHFTLLRQRQSEEQRIEASRCADQQFTSIQDFSFHDFISLCIANLITGFAWRIFRHTHLLKS
ncbi:hypothetical protein BR93DRAFT_534979 [Coniochaeta sp. PMI_546]|nr:hypothetical protein BR93DRAFT_534979 [Coniochaeta sp. PMI_546]